MQRFTLAHELGHYLMNHFDDCFDKCTLTELDNLANCFARNILVPVDYLKTRDIYKLPNYFAVSLAAAEARLSFYSIDYNALEETRIENYINEALEDLEYTQ